MIDKHCRIRKTFGCSWDEIDCDMTSAQGWAYYNWSLENEVTMAGPVAERAGLGYIGQERERLLEELKAKQNG